ncbi:hypothetical protein B0A50_03169 [Salinomyces thailandicus]|uniref:Uncharacterized protein n=1 Tax=Salinomyces thailandicus TaxID=706561 RepID=A0A4U0U6I9_9PEZI|nr:hypothetical protein B0A50_03169 [Salinomyces thailandica]
MLPRPPAHPPRLAAILRPRIGLVFGGLLCYRIALAASYSASRVPHPTLLLAAALDSTHDQAGNNISVNLVVASVAADNLAWTSHFPNSNINLIRYISDDPTAPYHPPAPKGREALMYLTYLNDFYDDLPDLSIFIHADEIQWHIEGTLLRNLSFALTQLDFQQVLDREYFNLRATWRAACPAWINTTKTFDDPDPKPEEPYMKEAWMGNFGPEDPVPETMGGPCCSQFAVSRTAIRRRPREQYARSQDWLLQTDWDDFTSGRVWEHLWPKLFKDVASDCEFRERYSLCQMYRLCFKSEEALVVYNDLWEEIERLKEQLNFFRATWAPGKARVARRRLWEVNAETEAQLRTAWELGSDANARADMLNLVHT